MKYDNFQYIFPPRPSIKCPPTNLKNYETKFMAQPKLNGSCAILFTNGEKVIFMNRHKDKFSRVTIPNSELSKLHRGDGWCVVVGEYMNKAKLDGNKKLFNDKFVIFDILVYQNKYLINTTFLERQELLSKLYSAEYFDKFISKISDTLYKCNIVTNCTQSWNEITNVDMYEGFVLKNPSSPLDVGYRSENNTNWQIKFRKSNRQYIY